MDKDNRMVNDLLVKLFNDVLEIEGEEYPIPYYLYKE